MRYSALTKHLKKAMALVAAVGIAFGVAQAYSLDAHRIVTGQDIINAENDGTLIAQGSCNFNNPGGGWPTVRAVDVSTFNSCVRNNGACTGPGQRMIDWGTVSACKVIYAQQTLSANGTATSSDTNGDPASPYTVSGATAVSVSNGTYPVSWNIAAMTGTLTGCGATISVGGTTIATIGTTGGTGTYTGGLTGTITYTLTQSHNSGLNQVTCSSSGTITYYN